MNSLVRLLRKLELLIRRGRLHRELDQELRAEGISAEETRYVTRRRFGNDLRLKEQSHEIVGFRLESILLDLRYAVRQLRKNPGFACTAVVVLALGIAGSVAIFAFVDAALVQPLPYQNPFPSRERL
jgi:macrolide transport system ATP-binding/permease protein